MSSPSEPVLRVRLAENHELESCLDLRRKVFVEEQGIALSDEVDGKDSECLHVLATLDDAPVGAARLSFAQTALKVQRVCVLSERRGQGIGLAIMAFAQQEAARRPGVSALTVGAQRDALPFYERLGFRPTGEVHMDAGIAHRDMILLLEDT